MQKETLGALFRVLLKQKGYTQKRLAEKIAVDPSTVNKWIKGYNRFSYEDALKVYHELELDYDDARILFRAAGLPPPPRDTARVHRSPPILEDLSAHYVHRPGVFQTIKKSLLSETHGSNTAITSALKGAGGYGKTTLALALCHDRDIQEQFPDGIEWIPFGESLRPADLVYRIKDLIYRLSQSSPAVESLEAAQAELRALLEARRLLLVLDDVWFSAHLKPFIQGAPSCARLITTRNEEVVALYDIPTIRVDAMSPEEAVQVLSSRIGSAEDLLPHEQTLYEIASRLKAWPLLLALANGIVYSLVKRHSYLLPDAFLYLHQALDRRGLVAFDPDQPQQRKDAVARTLEVSFQLLKSGERGETHYARALELAIFPEDIFIPLDVLHRFWHAAGHFDAFDTEALCLHLYEISVLRSYDRGTRRARLHDVIRDYLRTKIGSHLPVFHQQFLATYHLTRWADLPLEEDYLWTYLVSHLLEAKRPDWLRETMMDLRYLATKIFVHHQSAYAAEADLIQAKKALAAEASLTRLQEHIARAGSLLHQCETLQETEVVLLNSIDSLDEWAEARRLFQQAIPRPLFLPWHPLPGSKETELIRTMYGHAGSVTDCAFSPDGDWIVSASSDATLKLWNAHTGACRFTLEAHTAPVTSCTFNPGGNRILSTSEDGTIRIWNAYTGNELLTLRGHEKTVTCCAVAPDGTWIVSASADRTLRIWDIHTVNELRPLREYKGVTQRILRGHEGAVMRCAVSPDGTWIVSASTDQTLRLWNARTGKDLPPAFEQDDELNACAISPDGTWMASTSGVGLNVWDLNTRSVRFAAVGHIGIVEGCAISPDGTWMLSASDDTTLKGWRTDRELDIFILKGHADWVKQCAISPDGKRIVSASDDHTLKVWNVPVLREERLPDEEEYAYGLEGCAISPSGDWAVSVSMNGELKRWKTSTGVEYQPLLSNAASPSAKCVISPDGTWVATTIDQDERSLTLWDAHSGTERLTLAGHTEAILSCAVSRDGNRIVTASADQTLKVWDARSGIALLTLTGHTGKVQSCAISPDGKWMVSASEDKTLKTWDAETGVEQQTFLGHTGAVLFCTISPAGDRIISASQDETVRIWDVSSPSALPRLLKHPAAIQACAMSPRGDLLVVLTKNQLKLWDSVSGICLTTFYAPNMLSDGVFHPDGEHLLVAAENGLYFLRLVR